MDCRRAPGTRTLRFYRNAMAEPQADFRRRLARQKRILTWLAVFLVVMGAVVLLFLQRMPLPMRLLIGLFDVLAGLVLLLFVRPKFDV